MASTKPSKRKQRSKDVLPAEAEVLDVIQETVKALGFEAIESGFRTPDETVDERLDAATGFWIQGYRGKVARVIVNVAHEKSGYRLKFSDLDGSRYLGGANTKTGVAPKVALVFRILPLVKSASGFRRLEDWSWILCLVLEKPLPLLNSSEAIRAVSFAEGILGAGEDVFNFRQWALVGVVDPHATVSISKSQPAINYGQITMALAKLLQSDSAPDKTGDVEPQADLLEEESDE